VALAGAGVVPGAYWGSVGLGEAGADAPLGAEELGDRDAEPVVVTLPGTMVPPVGRGLAVATAADERAGDDCVAVLPHAAIQPTRTRLMSTGTRLGNGW
jgi:hypothetical protein